MAPKPAPKLTKKQIQQQKKEAARIQKQKEEEEAQIQRERLAEQARILQKERQKLLEEQRIRIVSQKQKNYPQLQAKIKKQNQALAQLRQKENWQKFTTPYYRNYNIQGTNLSTFFSMFKNAVYKNPESTLQLCQQSQIYITNLEEKILEYRSEYKQQDQLKCKKQIQQLQAEQIKKLEQIMIQFANSAEELEEKNIEEAKKKNEGNTAQKAIKPIDSISAMTPNFKIGMYIHTYSTKNYNKFAPIGIKQFGFNSDMPPKWSSNLAHVKFEWTNFNNYSPHSKEQFRIVGGVFNLQFYDLPPVTKKASTILIKKHYKGKQILNRFKLQPSVIKQSFKVMYEIPKYIFLAPYKNGNKSALKIAQYDLAAQKWNILPPDSIIEYIQAQNRVICKVARPQPIAFVQQKCADYPYRAWQLRTVQPGKVLLDFELRRDYFINEEKKPLMLQFQIGPNVVKLHMEEKYDQLSDLCEDFFTPQAILHQLSRRGIHILPIDQDYEYAGIKIKDRQAQKNAIRDLAYAVQSFTIRSEPNDSNNIAVKIRENLEYQNIFLEDQDKDWKKIRWGDSDKCWVDNRGIKQRHMNLTVLLQQHDFCEKQCVERMKYDKSYLLRKTIMKMLSLTRILAFTTGDNQTASQLVQCLKKKIIVE